jgi:hypothetical protein
MKKINITISWCPDVTFPPQSKRNRSQLTGIQKEQKRVDSKSGFRWTISKESCQQTWFAKVIRKLFPNFAIFWKLGQVTDCVFFCWMSRIASVWETPRLSKCNWSFLSDVSPWKSRCHVTPRGISIVQSNCHTCFIFLAEADQQLNRRPFHGHPPKCRTPLSYHLTSP